MLSSGRTHETPRECGVVLCYYLGPNFEIREVSAVN